MPDPKAELLQRINQSWQALDAVVRSLSDAQLASPGPEEWSIKDHLTHLMAWENSMVYLLRGRARHLGLGVDEALYLRGDDDEINAAIQQKHRDRTLAEVLTQWRSVHQQMLAALARLSDSDLGKTYSQFLPDEPGEDSGEAVLSRISGNTYEHFDEHRAYIQSVAAGP